MADPGTEMFRHPRELLEKLYWDNNFCDYVIIVREAFTETRFNVNSWILTANSEVFKAIFQDAGFLEERLKEIVITDFLPETVEKMLKYFYLKRIDVLKCYEIVDLLKIAEKYQATDLSECCSEILLEKMSLKHACMFYDTFKMYKVNSLKNRCFDLINRTVMLLIKKSYFQDMMTRESQLEILSSDYLAVPNEMWLFETLRSLGLDECTCSQANVPCLMSAIRVQFFTVEEIEKCKELGLDIGRHLPKKNERRVLTSFPRTRFFEVLNFDLDDIDPQTISGTAECIVFQPNADVYFTGLEFIVGSKFYNEKPQVKISSLDERCRKVNEWHVSTDDEMLYNNYHYSQTSTCRVQFLFPMLINYDQVYRIELVGLTKVQLMCTDILKPRFYTKNSMISVLSSRVKAISGLHLYPADDVAKKPLLKTPPC